MCSFWWVNILLTCLYIHTLPRLESLSLNLCGRGFGDSAAAALAKGNRLENLRVLALGGAYRLRDSGLLEILKAAPNLEELRLPQCCRIQGTALQSLPALTPKLRCVLHVVRPGIAFCIACPISGSANFQDPQQRGQSRRGFKYPLLQHMRLFKIVLWSSFQLQGDLFRPTELLHFQRGFQS